MPVSDLANMLEPPLKRSLANDIVDRLRQAIFSGRFAPNERLREEILAELLDVSRGPIREALSQLEREGLVIKEPNRGAIVAMLSREDLEEVYSLRLSLEQLAVRQAVYHAEPSHLDEMQLIVNKMAVAVERGTSPQESATLDIDFHEVLYKASKHARLYNMWANLRPQVHIFLLSRFVANTDFRDYIIPSHQIIVDALRKKDENQAYLLITDHVTHAYERLLKSYKQHALPSE